MFFDIDKIQEGESALVVKDHVSSLSSRHTNDKKGFTILSTNGVYFMNSFTTA